MHKVRESSLKLESMLGFVYFVMVDFKSTAVWFGTGSPEQRNRIKEIKLMLSMVQLGTILKMKVHFFNLNQVGFFILLFCILFGCSVKNDNTIIKIRHDIQWKDENIPKFIKSYIEEIKPINPVLINIYKQTFDSTRVVISQIESERLKHESQNLNYLEYYIMDKDTIYIDSNLKELFTTQKPNDEYEVTFEAKQWQILILQDTIIYEKKVSRLNNWIRFLPPEKKKNSPF